MTSPDRPSPVRPVDYKGEPLDADRGPGLGCFWIQVALLVTLIVLTPLTVAWNWPAPVSIALLFLTLVLLLFAGQTVIFLLRLIAADRREGTRHVPRAASTPTVGQLEDAAHVDAGTLADPGERPGAAAPGAPASAAQPATTAAADHQPADPGVRE